MTSPITDQGAHDLLVNARIHLLLDQFFFGRLAMKLQLREDLTIPTLAVDGKHIFYNPEFVRAQSPDLRKSALIHELLHCVMEHFVRRNGRDPQTWNRAADYAINPIIKDAGFKLGEGWLYDPAFLGLTTEHIYELLKQEQDQHVGPSKPSNQPGQGPGQPQPGQGQGQQPPQRGDAFDQVLDGCSTPGEAVEQSLEWQVAVAEAGQLAREYGKLPGALERFLKDIEPPQVPWRDVLQRFITQVAADDYAWSRPNRKLIPHGYYLPGLYSQEMGKFVAIIDTSGSIDAPVLNAVWSEVVAAHAVCKPERLYVVPCDTQVGNVIEFDRHDPLVLDEDLGGGGGTDFRPPFEWMDENEVEPVAAIYLTDGEGRFPAEPPPYPVLWCMTTDVQPPWGEVVRIRL